LELEFELWFELEFELVLLLWLELALDRPRSFLDWRLMVRRFETARARHHSIDFPSILTFTGAAALEGAFAVRAAWSSMGAAVAGSPSDRDDSGSRADPTASPSAPNAPA
jgi:hypothetical protein